MRYEDVEVGKKYVVCDYTDSGHFYRIGDVVEVLGKHIGREVEIHCIKENGTLEQYLRPEELKPL